MFQDSVPAGSYNDPFLSSVCDILLFPIVSYCFLLFPIVSFLEIQYDIPRLVTDGHGGSGASQCLSSQGTAFS